MTEIKGTLEEGTFYQCKRYYYDNPEDMREFEQLMNDPEAPVHEVNYYDEYVEVLLRPDWR